MVKKFSNGPPYDYRWIEVGVYFSEIRGEVKTKIAARSCMARVHGIDETEGGVLPRVHADGWSFVIFSFPSIFLNFQNFSNRSPSLDLLDTVLGPDWDLYLMSLIIGLIVWLAYCYFRNRQNGGGGAAQQPQQ